MNERPKEPGLTRFSTLFFIGCFAIVVYFLYLILSPFFSILLWAGVLTVVFLPLFRVVLRHCRGQRTLASLITCLLILLLIVLPVFLLGLVVTHQSVALYQTVQGGVEGETANRIRALEQHPWVQWALVQASRWTGTDKLALRPTVEQVLRLFSRFLISQGPSLLRGFGQLMFGFLLMFIAMFFLFRDGPQLLALIEASNPLPAQYESEIIQRFQDVSFATFFGSILTALVQGLAGAILFWILGIASPLFWGAVIAFVSLVPIVGAFLVWLPWSGYLFLVGQSGRALALLAIGGLVVSSIDNLLKPMIIQGRTNMHPLLVFLSVLGGMQAFGFQGIIVGPLVVALFVSFLSFYKIEFRDSLRDKLGGKA